MPTPPSTDETSGGPHLVVLCATRRGLAFVRRLGDLSPHARLTIFSFREQGREPPYFEALQQFALARNARFFESPRVEKGPGSEVWAESIDAVFLVNWRYRVSAERMRGSRFGAFVFHDSLLPRYRGFSPVVWAIANGEPTTGATLFRLIEEIDAGPIVDQVAVPIGPDETIASVFERVTEAYLVLIERDLPAILAGEAPGCAQDATAATYVRKRTPEDNRIDWSRSTASIHNLIRAVTHPYPGAYSFCGGGRVTIWASRTGPALRTDGGRLPGQVVELRGGGVVALTGDGSLMLERIQVEDGPEVPASEVLSVGVRLE